MSTLFRLFLLSVALAALLISCNGEGQPDDKTNISYRELGHSDKVQKLNAKMLSHLIDNRNNQVLLINVWATWCIPCREEFPDLVKLADSYRDKGLEIIGISADYPDEISSKIIPFIKEENVNFSIFVQNFDRQEDLINYLNEEWSGALPATFIFDKLGKQREFLLGKQTYIQLEAAIEKYL